MNWPLVLTIGLGLIMAVAWAFVIVNAFELGDDQ